MCFKDGILKDEAFPLPSIVLVVVVALVLARFLVHTRNAQRLLLFALLFFFHPRAALRPRSPIDDEDDDDDEDDWGRGTDASRQAAHSIAEPRASSKNLARS
jgi:hypothetical protein